MQLKAFITGKSELRRFERLADRLASGAWRPEANRGVIDAARKTRTQVQRAVAKQMAIRSIQAGVIAHVRLANDASTLSSTIMSARGGQPIDAYKGLRVLGRRKAEGEAGTVRSGVWERPRVFKQSFANERGHFATLPGGGSGRAPRALWTFGKKGSQPRDAGGRFGKSGITYGPTCRLFGPALRDELGRGESAATFHRVGPQLLEQAISKRLGRIMRF